jgi:VanZ family protein
VKLTLPPPPWLRALCLAAFGAALVQIFLLAEPEVLTQLKNVFWDKLCHAAAYGFIATLFWIGIGFEAPWLGAVTVIAVGVLDEVNQIFTPGRTADVLDVMADAAGILAATWLLVWLTEPSRLRGNSALSTTSD